MPAFPHDFRVAPGSFDLESSTAFVEPGTPLIAMVVFEFELLVTPDERGTSLQAGIRSGVRNEKAKAIKTKKGIREWAGFAVSSAAPTSC